MTTSYKVNLDVGNALALQVTQNIPAGITYDVLKKHNYVFDEVPAGALLHLIVVGKAFEQVVANDAETYREGLQVEHMTDEDAHGLMNQVPRIESHLIAKGFIEPLSDEEAAFLASQDTEATMH